MNLATKPEKKGPRVYSLEMTGWTLVLFVGLSLATGAALFYTGLVTGMGLRTPGTVPPVTVRDAQSPPSGTSAEDFFKSLDAKKPAVEPVSPSPLHEVSRELPVEVVPPAGDTPPAANPPAPTQPTVQSPAQSSAHTPAAAEKPPAKPTARPASPTEPYTVQVFTSSHQKNAQDIVSRLVKSGFPAYVSQGQDGKAVIYRVRVGRNLSRAEAEKLKDRLIKEGKMKDPTLVKL
ncbi:MAG: SPOR domain-containing protein [Deltaproteobacteria bacterium]|nr:SPOR domain-containing protein [Deltaproteobacteria bacterium]